MKSLDLTTEQMFAVPGYRVTYLVRSNGALGKFYPKAVMVGGAASAKAACSAAFDQLHQMGYETLSPVLIERATWKNPASLEIQMDDVTGEIRG